MFKWLCRLGDELRHGARRRRWTADLASGRRGEDLAHRFLERRGYRVVARNYRPASGAGEIDLTAWDGNRLVFIEVKSRSGEEYGSPDRAVDQEKERRIVRAAADYARKAGVPLEDARFDLVNVILSNPPRLAIIRDAFRPSPRAPGSRPAEQL